MQHAACVYTLRSRPSGTRRSVPPAELSGASGQSLASTLQTPLSAWIGAPSGWSGGSADAALKDLWQKPGAAGRRGTTRASPPYLLLTCAQSPVPSSSPLPSGRAWKHESQAPSTAASARLLARPSAGWPAQLCLLQTRCSRSARGCRASPNDLSRRPARTQRHHTGFRASLALHPSQ
eukprot:scaffold4498_cov119-Isochrysis_galbana.AAC.59